MLKRLSIPSVLEALTGTSITGGEVWAAACPAAVAVYWAIHWGVRWELVMRTVKGMEKEVRVVRHGCRVGRSEWSP